MRPPLVEISTEKGLQIVIMLLIRKDKSGIRMENMS